MIDGHRGELRERLVDDQLCECVDVFNIDTGFGHGRHAQTVTECDIRVCSFPADLFGSLAAVKFSTEYHADALDFVGNGRSHMCKYCVEYGNGTKWYLNPANFDPELVKKPGHAVGYMNLTGASRNSFEWGGKDPQGPVDMGNEGYLNMAIDTMLQQVGCKNEAPCIIKCQYGGIQYSPLKDIVTVNQFKCFGCGLCRTACKYGALKLVSRDTFPSLVDVW